ncbi:BTAD domain-containing putative transcriptional regulator [Actinomadura sp. 6N118]|uniref:BTAD domain-containing putative transcriptional regulator n=1 Tax=Actinomadura sp. 6N118 TaxID=3375151 RepID=UPI00379CDE41
MTLVAKSAVPVGAGPDAAHEAFERAALGGVTLLDAPPGCLLTEGLATVLARRTDQVIWSRMGSEDRDPASFLLSVIAGAQRHEPEFGQETLTLMRRCPGPVEGWPPLFNQLGCELRKHLCETGAIVLENVHHLNGKSPVFALAGAHLFPVLDAGTTCVLVSHGRIPLTLLPKGALYRGPADLRMPSARIQRSLREIAPDLPARERDRMSVLAHGRAAVIDAVRAVKTSLGGEEVLPSILRACRSRNPLAPFGEALLDRVTAEARQALGLVMRTQYGHVGLTPDSAPRGPWLQRLDGEWARVRTCWCESLPAWSPDPQALSGAADRLLCSGGLEQAVDLYFELGQEERAAWAINDQLDRLMDLGQWGTVRTWLHRLPEDLVVAYPELASSRAEMAAVSGDSRTARRWFSVAASQFGGAGNAFGACRSMLAESVVSDGAGDLGTAEARAGAALAVADAAGLGPLRSWSSWQQGRLALRTGDVEAALTAFARAVEGEDAPAELAGEAGVLVRQLRELRRQCQAHRADLVSLERAEKEFVDQLLAYLKAWPHRVQVSAESWSNMPPPAKFYGQGFGVGKLARLRTRLTQWSSQVYRAAPEAGWRPRLTAEVAAPMTAVARARLTAAAIDGQGASTQADLQLSVHLLGSLQVNVGARLVKRWPGGRSRSLLAYLLTHRNPWPRRETLMEEYWPGASPKAARNSLNVAIHGLRKVLGTATDSPVIVLADDRYQLHPGITLWLDVEDFEGAVEQARRLEAAGRTVDAAESFERALGLYRGDFLSDVPYEDWSVLIRERLRLAGLDALDRLSALHFSAGRYAACAELCRRTIAIDPCREDAHRTLMRSYSRQGQPHLALFQYQTCARLLTTELGVQPGASTQELYERIRGHENL